MIDNSDLGQMKEIGKSFVANVSKSSYAGTEVIKDKIHKKIKHKN